MKTMVGFLENKIEKIINEINNLIDNSNKLCASGNIEFSRRLDVSIDQKYKELNITTDKLNRIELKGIENE